MQVMQRNCGWWNQSWTWTVIILQLPPESLSQSLAGKWCTENPGFHPKKEGVVVNPELMHGFPTSIFPQTGKIRGGILNGRVLIKPWSKNCRRQKFQIFVPYFTKPQGTFTRKWKIRPTTYNKIKMQPSHHSWENRKTKARFLEGTVGYKCNKLKKSF